MLFERFMVDIMVDIYHIHLFRVYILIEQDYFILSS